MLRVQIIVPIFIVIILILIFAYGNHSFSKSKRNIKVDYKINFTEDKSVKDEDVLKLWIPLPSSNLNQKVSEIRVTGLKDYKITEDKIWGNRMIYFYSAIKTLPKEIAVSYSVVRNENNKKNSRDSFRGDKSLYLKPSNFAVHSDRVKRLANNLNLKGSNVEETSRNIYDFVLSHMHYSKDTKGGDVESICIALENNPEGVGNCTDYHSLFSSIMQIQKIPTRLVMGIPLSAENGSLSEGYHCWAEFLSDDSKWYPVDISEADKDPSMVDYFFKSIDSDRIAFSVGRDIILNPAQKGIALNFFGPYPYGELNGRSYNKFKTTINYN